MIRSAGSGAIQPIREFWRNSWKRPSISLWVPVADLEQAREIAERTGVGYQTVLKQAIRQGLKKTG